MVLPWRRRRAARNAAKEQDLELVIPRHFCCPISLDLMKDPVTLSTGMTYDRDNIEKWIEEGHHTCPKTNQVLRSLEPIPNHTLRKMIQEWCVEYRSYGIERIPTPRIPIRSSEVLEILAKIEAANNRKDGEACRELVIKIKALAKESEKNKRSLLASGTNRVLAATFKGFSESKVSSEKNITVLEEILSALAMMLPLDGEAKSLLGSTSSLRCMAWLLRYGSLSVRRNAVYVLIEILSSADHEKVATLVEIGGVLEALVKLVKEPICPATTKASLLLMYHLVSKSSSAKNEEIIASFADMGLVELLLEMLVDSEKSLSEKALGILDEICNSSEGREKVYSCALTIPVLVKKILRISDLATQFSVSILWKLVKNEEREEGDAIIEALQLGAFQKLLLLLQVGCADRTKEKANEVLKLLNLYRDRAECTDSLDFKNLKRTF